MTFSRLLRRSLAHHWRGNLAVLLGVAVGAAVLTGALLVGDSLRGSLLARSLEQLGWVDEALVAGRFFRAVLAEQLGAKRACAAILLRGSARRATPLGQEAAADSASPRVNQVTILGVDAAFWAGAGPLSETFWQSDEAGAVLNATLARELSVTSGDDITLSLQKASHVPRESLLGRRQAADVLDEVRVTVRQVVPDDGVGRFSLAPSAGLPRNVFVPLRFLQARLEQPGRANALLVEGADSNLAENLRRNLTLDDWGLQLRSPESRTDDLFAKLDRNRDGRLTRGEWSRRVAGSFARAIEQDGVLTRERVLDFYRTRRGYLSLESRHMLLEPAVVAAAEKAATTAKVRAIPMLVYLANRIEAGGRSVPYSVVAAVDPAAPPFPEVGGLKDNEVLLVQFDGTPWPAASEATLDYFEPRHEGGLREKQVKLAVKGVVPVAAVDDPDLSPEFPGITDKLGIKEWDPPFPYDSKRVQPADEKFWEEHRTTPKAYVTLATGQRLWGTRFGDLTSIRLVPASGNDELARDSRSLADAVRRNLLENLPPEAGGLVFDPVRRRALESSQGFMDFGGLFLGFSCFLIAAALLLVGLLFRLNLDRRAPEVGVLLATGWRRSAVGKQLLAEGLALAIVGSFIGLAGAMGYAVVMLHLLRAWWPGGIDGSFLQPHFGSGSTFVIGYVATVVVSILTIGWSVWAMARVAPRALLHGETSDDEGIAAKPARRAPWVGWLALAGAAGCLVLGAFVRGHEPRAITFFGSGALLLTSGLAWLWVGLVRSEAGLPIRSGPLAVPRLGARNAGRHAARSMLTAGLLAAAAFLVVAVESFHRDPGTEFQTKEGGSGGFSLIAESDVPIYQDLADSQSWRELDLPEQTADTLKSVEIVSLRLRAGDDTSCLNLYQPGRPRLLGVPHSLVERGGFHFQEPAGGNPWHLLETPLPDGAIPVFGEANSVAYMLKKGLNQDLVVPDERGEPVRLRIVGLLKDSIFQSELLMSEANFLRLYPRQEGHQFFLIAAPGERETKIIDLLERGLAGQGFAVTPAARRLEAYLAVENTYLATFQLLGGLGLVLGALGLAVVLLRTVWERRGELALLRALGFRRAALGRLVLSENALLLLLGLAIGTAAALVSVAPHLLAGEGAVPWARLAALLALVAGVGLTSSTIATALTLRARLLDALRHE